MKHLFIALACLVALTSCGPQLQNGNTASIVVNPEATNLGASLNLQALGEMVRTSKDAQDIESKLNQPSSINNLDLDGDGKVDYIKVTEYGDGTNRGFSFTVDLANGEKQEVATVEIQKNDTQQATMNINGNASVYGSQQNYSSNFTLTDFLILNYLFSPHSYYYSPYRYGYYPSYYHPYGCVSSGYYAGRVGYVTRTTHYSRPTTTTVSKIKSPNSSYASKSVSSRASSLSSPTRSQRSFSTTSNSASRPSTSGFGSKSSSSSRSFGSSSRGGRR